MVSIQEQFKIKSGLQWHAYGILFKKYNITWISNKCDDFVCIFGCSDTTFWSNFSTFIIINPSFFKILAESGPSGSHFGLLAALFVEVVNAWPLLKHPGRAIAKLSLIMLALMILGLLPWVDNYAHTFGFIGGLLLSFALFPYVNFDSSAESAYPVQCHILRGASVAVFIGLLVTMQLVFYLLPEFQCEVNMFEQQFQIYYIITWI